MSQKIDFHALYTLSKMILPCAFQLAPPHIVGSVREDMDVK